MSIDLAEKSEGRCRHVTFILKGNKVISTGVNLLKTDTFAYRLYQYPYVHSELNAIKNAKRYDLSKCTLINFRVSRDGKRFL